MSSCLLQVPQCYIELLTCQFYSSLTFMICFRILLVIIEFNLEESCQEWSQTLPSVAKQ